MPQDLLAEIVAQRERILAIRAKIEAVETAELRPATRMFAELLARTREHPDPAVNPTAAARAAGFSKHYAFQLMKRLDEGDL